MRQWTIGHIIGGPYEAGWRLSLPLCAARCGGHDLARAALRARTRQRLPRVRRREPLQSCREGSLTGARRWRDPDREQRHPRLPQRARTVGAADPRRVTGAPGDPQARGDRARHLRAVGQTVGSPPRPGPRERHQALAGAGPRRPQRARRGGGRRWTTAGSTPRRRGDHGDRRGGVGSADQSRSRNPFQPAIGRVRRPASRDAAFRADPANALMEDDMNDRIALITGVGDATGAALARRFVQGGYRVAMIARNAERLAELERKIPGAHRYPCDVADLDRLGAVVDRVEAELGAPHVLVHNAVAATSAKIFETSVADLERNFRVNTTSLFFLAQKLAPAMIERGEGAIMVTGNTSSFRGIPVRPAWAPTKAAQRILAQCLSKDLGPKRVHVGYITIDAVIDAPWLASARGARRIEPPADWQYERDDYFAHPDAIADEVYHIAHQHPSTWSFDHVIRPFAESWTLN